MVVFLAEHPELGKDRSAVKVDYKSYAIGSHVVFFRKTNTSIRVLRILHQRMDFGQLSVSNYVTFDRLHNSCCMNKLSCSISFHQAHPENSIRYVLLFFFVILNDHPVLFILPVQHHRLSIDRMLNLCFCLS